MTHLIAELETTQSNSAARTTEYIELAIAACELAAVGDLEARIIAADCDDEQMKRLFDAINRILDISDSYTREAAAAMQLCSEGKFHRPILLRGMRGAYKSSAQKINAAAVSMKTAQERIQALELQRKETARSAQSTVETLSQSVDSLEQISHLTSKNARQTLDLASSVSTASRDTAHNLVAISAACEELAATTNQISQQMGQTQKLSQNANGQMDSFSKVFDELRDAVARITPVVGIIQRISNQTNLLSLNATIEATRAGDAGKGFAVVATEVKELSRSTANATKKIQEQIEQIRATSETAVHCVSVIKDSMSQISENTNTASYSLSEQTIATNEIAQNVGGASDSATRISRDIEGVTAAAETATQTIADLDVVAQKLGSESQQLETEVAKLLH